MRQSLEREADFDGENLEVVLGAIVARLLAVRSDSTATSATACDEYDFARWDT